MIRDLSQTLQAMLSDPSLKTTFPELSVAQVAFDRPDDQFKPSQTTVNLFLFNIHEDMELRSNEPVVERLNGQAITHNAPLRVACTYLVTAWPVGGTDLALQEHRLLAQMMQVFARYPKIPDAYLQGSLVGQTPPLPMMTAQAAEMSNPQEFWTAIGNRMHPSITIKVTIALQIIQPVTAPMVTTEVVHLGVRSAPDQQQLLPDTQSGSYRIGGTVTRAGAPVAGAVVSVPGTTLTAQTGDDGRYVLDVMQSGPCTLHIVAGTDTKDLQVTIPAAAGSSYDVQF